MVLLSQINTGQEIRPQSVGLCVCLCMCVLGRAQSIAYSVLFSTTRHSEEFGRVLNVSASIYIYKHVREERSTASLGIMLSMQSIVLLIR